MKKPLAVALLLCLVCGACATYGNKAIEDQSKVAQVQVGSTQEEVRAAIGDPAKIDFTGDQEVWTYTLTRAQVRAASFIPIVGIFAGGMDATGKNLTVLFDKSGKVAKIGEGRFTGAGGSVTD